MKPHALLLASLLAAATAGSPATAAAPPSGDAVSAARDHFQRGVELFREGDFAAALVEFRRTDELAPTYKLSYNIGQACFELRDYACALSAFRRYLKGGGDA